MAHTACPIRPPKMSMSSTDRRDFRCCDLEHISLIVHQEDDVLTWFQAIEFFKRRPKRHFPPSPVQRSSMCCPHPCL